MAGTPDFLAAPEDLAVLVRKPSTHPQVLLALRRASGRFRDEVGYPVTQVVDDTMTRLGDGTDKLFLKGAPVTAVSVSSGGTLIDPSLYTLDAENGILYANGSNWDWRIPFDITYTHGFTTIPVGIQDAVLEHATTICLAYAHVQQETALTNNASYAMAATVGTTQKWADTVKRYDLTGRA
jgi:hypothetical protein